MKTRFSSRSFWLGFALAIGLLAGTTVVAVAQTHGPSAHVTGTAAPPVWHLSDRLSVLSRGRALSDDVPAGAASRASRVVASAPSGEPSPGNLQFDRSKLLIDQVGNTAVGFYAVPTSRGQVCGFVFGDFDGCTGSANFSGAPINIEESDADQVGAGEPITVYGLALDDVDSVTVFDNMGVANDALVRNNAFYVKLKAAGAWPDRAVVGLRDGSSRTIAIPGGAPPG